MSGTCPDCGHDMCMCGTPAYSFCEGDYRENGKVIDVLTELCEMRAEIERLRAENDAYVAQFKSVGIVPYLERMTQLAEQRDAARRLLLEACDYEQCYLPSEWCERAAKQAGEV